jgi:hypothetical protein
MTYLLCKIHLAHNYDNKNLTYCKHFQKVSLSGISTAGPVVLGRSGEDQPCYTPVLCSKQNTAGVHYRREAIHRIQVADSIVIINRIRLDIFIKFNKLELFFTILFPCQRSPYKFFYVIVKTYKCI